MCMSATVRPRFPAPLPLPTHPIFNLQGQSAALFLLAVSDWETALSSATSQLITLLAEKFSSRDPTYSKDTLRIQHVPRKPSQMMAGYAQVMSASSYLMDLWRSLTAQRISLSCLRVSILLPKNLRTSTLRSLKSPRSSSMETQWRITSSL